MIIYRAIEFATLRIAQVNVAVHALSYSRTKTCLCTMSYNNILFKL